MAVVEEREGLLRESPFRKPGTRSRRVTSIAALGLVVFFPLIAIPLFDSYAYVLQVGRSVLSGNARDLSSNEDVQRIYLGIDG